MSSIFQIIKKSQEVKLARAGAIHTAHGDILTPAFIPVATKATVKSLTTEQIEKYISPEALLANTYHLYLEPGEKTVQEHGGLAKMMNWQHPTMTDSGGFQVFSLGQAMGRSVSKVATVQSLNENLNKSEEFERLAEIDDEGVTFKSYLDGSKHRFTPERSVQIQHDLGADIFFAFDECTSPLAPIEYQKEAMSRTHNWAERCLIEHLKLGKSSATDQEQYLFAVIQGGAYEDLRRESARVLARMKITPSVSLRSPASPGEATLRLAPDVIASLGEAPRSGEGVSFDGFGIGGSFTKEDIGTAVKWVIEELNKNEAENKPRHLLGIGEPIDIFLGIENGIDTFDCVSATRIARNGRIYSTTGPINILNSQYKNDMSVICDDPSCYAHNYTKSYLSHLFRSKEMLAATIASIHNLHFIVSLTKNIRQAILDDKFLEYKKEFCEKYYGEDTELSAQG